MKEDAYIREGGNANKNYNFEEITKAHGDQYVGKGYKVLNSKYSGSNSEIIGVMKLPLPTMEEINTNEFDTFALQFSIFKNANYNEGNQTYIFHYTTDNNWSETSLTWNNKPTSIQRNSTDILFNFPIIVGDEYEKKTDDEKRITQDITATVEQLVAEGHTEMTVFVTSKESMNTSLLFHSKETSEVDKPARLIASKEGINLDRLKALVNEVSTVSEKEYTVDSFKMFSEKLTIAKTLINSENPQLADIKISYRELKSAFASLVKNEDPNDPGNIAYRKPIRSNLSKTIVDKANDGDMNTTWSGIFYPSYVDVDLMDTYALEKVAIYQPVGQKTYYSIYGSNDGKNYDRLHQKRSDEASSVTGDTIVFDTPQTYRILRIYLEYTEGDDKAYLSEVKAYGSKTSTNEEVLRDGSLEEI